MHDSHFEAVSDAYDKAHILYKLAWGLTKNKSINYGYWKEDTPSLKEALYNLNEFVTEQGDIQSGHIVADLGCGVGGTLFHIAKSKDITGYGVNINGKHLIDARKYARTHSNKSTITFLQESYLQTSIESNSVDRIIAIESMFHAPDKDLFLKECHRILKPNGKLIIADYFMRNEVLSTKESRLISNWLEGYESQGIDSKDKFDVYILNNELRKARYFNISKQVMPGSKRIHDWGKRGVKIYHILDRFGINIGLDYANAISPVYQYKTLSLGLWEYGVYVITKP